MKILTTILGLLVASAAGAFTHPSVHSQAMIENAQAILDSGDPLYIVAANTAWENEAKVSIAACVGWTPQCHKAMTPDYSHHTYTAQCPSNICVGLDDYGADPDPCCQLDMGNAGPCRISTDDGVNIGKTDCEAACVVGGNDDPTSAGAECDHLDANSTTRGYLDDDSECAMWNAVAYAVFHNLPNSQASYAQDAADIINDWTYQMKSVEIKDHEHRSVGNESALNTVSRLQGLVVAADLIWNAAVLSAADKTQFQEWMTGPMQFAAQDRVLSDNQYTNQSAAGQFMGLMVGFMNDDRAVWDTWLNGSAAKTGPTDPLVPGSTGLGVINEFGSDVVPGMYTFIDDGICPSDYSGSSCDLDRIDPDHGTTGVDLGWGETWNDADREESTFGRGSEGAFYSHKFLQHLSASVELVLNVDHVNLWHWQADDGSSLKEAAEFLYNGTKMVCDDSYDGVATPQVGGGGPDGLCDYDYTIVTNFCEDDNDGGGPPQTTGPCDGFCDEDGTTPSYCCADVTTSDDSPGFWGFQRPPTDDCTFWRKLEGRCTDKYDTAGSCGGDAECSGDPNGLCDTDGSSVSEKRSGWPFLARKLFNDAYHEPTWAAVADVDFPIDAVSRVDDGVWRTPEVLRPTFSRSSLDGASPCFWGGPSGAAGNNFTPCAESTN